MLATRSNLALAGGQGERAVVEDPDGGGSSGDGKRRPGRPPKIIDPARSAVAALGAELRRLRIGRGLTLAQRGRLVGYSGQHLVAVERGTTVPSEVVVSACDAAVLANGRSIAMLPAVIREQAQIRHQHEAARRPARLADPVEARARQVCDQDDLDWVRLADAARRPSRLSPAIVDDLELITARQRRLYYELSSTEMMVHVQAHGGLLMSLLDNAAPDSLRHRVASAAAEAAGFAAWLWYDLGDLYTMSHYYRWASLAAKESSNPGLRSYILGYQGLVAQAQGRPESAPEFLDKAQQTAQRSVSDPTRSWLTVLTADALAHVGRSRDAVVALDTAPASGERRGAEIQVGLAGARLASGDVEEAQRLALTSLETFAARGSVAGLQRVRELRGSFRARGHVRAAAAIDELARAWGAVPT